MNVEEHTEVHNIIKQYLDAYTSFCNKNEFSCAVLKKGNPGIDGKIDSLIDFMQYVARHYLQKDD